MIDKQKPLGPKTKGEVGVTDQGGNRIRETGPKEREVSNILSSDFQPNRKCSAPTEGVSSLETRDHLSRGTEPL